MLSQRAALRLLARGPGPAAPIRQLAAVSAGAQGEHGAAKPKTSPSMCVAAFGVAAASALGYRALQKSGLECDVTTSTTTTTTTITTTSTSAASAKAAKAPNDASGITDKVKNMAFVFVKPHAVTPATNKLVRETLLSKGIKIMSEGDLTSDVIDKKKLIDQHYYAIASKATLLKPTDLNVPSDKFEKHFGVTWDKAKSKAYNALDACEKLGCTSDELNSLWGAAKKADKLVKLGGGFYCGLVEKAGSEPIYVFNAFFMSMRSQFTAPGKKIHYFTVEWEEQDLPWEDFRGKVLGQTDPKTSPPGSLRKQILDEWKVLGLPSEPNTGDNGVHASASPFEGLCERMNWLEVQCKNDSYCRALVKAGVSEQTIKAWSVDPQVKLDDGKKGSIWDALEDLNATPCLEKTKKLQNLQ